MYKNFKKIISVSLAIVFGSFLLYNCEPEADKLGEQFFNPADVRTDSVNIIAYNISNQDTLRSDLTTARLGVLGAFDEPVFGMQKASYVTQARLGTYDPDFGANPVVDSVVLVMKPLIHSDSVTTTTNANFVYTGNVVTTKEVKSYPVAKYGKAKIAGAPAVFNIRVHEVTEFLNGPSTIYYSDKTVSLGQEIGSAVFNGNITSTVITKNDNNEELWKNDASLRIPMDATFFQNKIIAKEGMQELRDVANFTRYFKGIRISVDETDGYLFQFDPDTPEIKIYYKFDEVANGTTTRKQTSLSLPLVGRDVNGALHNVRIGQYSYDRAGTPSAAIPATPNIAGDEKIFLQGMGGPSAGIRIPASVIADLQQKFRDEKNAILSAKIKVTTDTDLWNNNYRKPSTFTLLEEGATGFMEDLAMVGAMPNFTFIRNFNLDKNPAYYEISVTRTLKSFVETAGSPKDMVLIMNMGDFLATSGTGYKLTSRAYALERVVLVGNEDDNPDRIKMKVTYGNKN